MARNIRVEIIGDASSLNRAFGQASSSSSRFGKSMMKVGKFAAIGLAGVGAGAVVAGKKMIDMASDAAEVQSKMEVVFGKALPGLTKEIDKFSEATGTSRFEMRKQAADLGALLEPLSASKKEAAAMSLQFTKLATDLGSFNNVPTADALLAIRSGLVGEAEPLRRFGVLLNEAKVQAEALRLGLIKKGETMTEQEKVQARASLIMKETSLAQDDATRTAGSMANQMKALRTNVSDAATEIGMSLLPSALKVVAAFNEHWPEIKRVAGEVFAAIASAAERAWPKVKAAGLAVIAWYQSDLLPTIRSIVETMRLLWEKFGADVLRVVKADLILIKNALNTAMALIRGDWDAAWKSMVPTVRGTFTAILALLTLQQAIIHAALVAIANSIKKALTNAFSDAGQLLVAAGRAIVQGLINGIASQIQPLLDIISRIRSIASAVSNVGPSHTSTPKWKGGSVGGRASGGPVSARTPYMVGERGPELFVPGRSGSIVPNGKGGGGVTVNVYGDVTGHDLVERVRQAFVQIQRDNGTVGFA